MARNRQRAKQRQAERRAARLSDPAGPADGRPASTGSDPRSIGPADDPATEAQLAAAAPPEETGRSDTVIESPPPPPDIGEDEDEEALEDEEAFDEDAFDDEDEDALEEDEEDATLAGARAAERRERLAGREHDDSKRRGKVMGFLANCWAELQRVQWPDRTTLTSLTGVVLGFVLLAGGYLGLLDAIFSRIIQAIL